jgi:hypothetical protein
MVNSPRSAVPLLCHDFTPQLVYPRTCHSPTVKTALHRSTWYCCHSSLCIVLNLRL